MKLAYVTFADNRYKPTRERARNEAKRLGIFDKVFALSEDDFDLNFRNVFYGEERDKMYAFGFYSWAPWACKYALDQIEENDILFYSDAGNALNPKGVKRFKEWIGMISKDDKDILGIIDSKRLECEYTKEDVFYHFGIEKGNEIRETGQYFVGALLIRKTNSSANLINKWYEYGSLRLDLIDNSIRLGNDKRFIACRYDQSLISVLLKMYDNVVNIDCSEVYRPNRSIEGIENAPFWAFRNKILTKETQIRLFPKRVINKICSILGLKRPFIYKM